jgi:hypothetical protein
VPGLEEEAEKNEIKIKIKVKKKEEGICVRVCNVELSLPERVGRGI